MLGCGPVGLAVITALKQRGIAPIVRRRTIRRAGAASRSVRAPTRRSIRSRLRHIAYPELRRPDNVVIFECIGVPGIIDQVFLAAPRNARIVVVGVCLEMDHSRPLIAINKELSVQYVLGYTLDEFARNAATHRATARSMWRR